MNFYCVFLFLCSLHPTILYRYLPKLKMSVYHYMDQKTNLVININEAPHHVLIVYGSKFCSGTLTSSRIVTTAASCFQKHKGERVVVKVGSNSMIGNGQIIPVLEYKIHEYFKHLTNLDNDIALLILQDHVTFGKNVMKAILVESEVALRVGIPIKVTGWGGTNLPLKYLNLALQTEMIVINRSECIEERSMLISPSNFCVKYISDRRLSDNGGGATFENLLVGIVSWGASMNSKTNYNVAILTNVSYFQRWITLNTKRLLTKYCVERKNKIRLYGGFEEYIDD